MSPRRRSLVSLVLKAPQTRGFFSALRMSPVSYTSAFVLLSLIGKMAAECDQQDVFPGQYFDSFEDFKSLLIKRHDIINEKLVIGKSSISVKTANAKSKKDFRFKEELVYTHVTYRCVHEGKFSSTGSSKQSTCVEI